MLKIPKPVDGIHEFVGVSGFVGGFADFSRGHEASHITYVPRNGVIETLRRFPIEDFSLNTLETYPETLPIDKNPEFCRF